MFFIYRKKSNLTKFKLFVFFKIEKKTILEKFELFGVELFRDLRYINYNIDYKISQNL